MNLSNAGLRVLRTCICVMYRISTYNFSHSIRHIRSSSACYTCLNSSLNLAIIPVDVKSKAHESSSAKCCPKFRPLMPHTCFMTYVNSRSKSRHRNYFLPQHKRHVLDQHFAVRITRNFPQCSGHYALCHSYHDLYRDHLPALASEVHSSAPDPSPPRCRSPNPRSTRPSMKWPTSPTC